MAKKHDTGLVGLKITEVRTMTKEEMESEGWVPRHDNPPPIIVLNDGTKIYPSQDDEGNGPGALFGMASDGKQFRVISATA